MRLIDSQLSTGVTATDLVDGLRKDVNSDQAMPSDTRNTVLTHIDVLSEAVNTRISRVFPKTQELSYIDILHLLHQEALNGADADLQALTEIIALQNILVAYSA